VLGGDARETICLVEVVGIVEDGEAVVDADALVVREVTEVGFYVVFARVVIYNADGDEQNASVRLTHDRPSEVNIDALGVRIGSSESQSLALQGTLRVDPGASKLIDLRCSSFGGIARERSIIALQVTALKFD
jgi:hypothetical protein